VELELSLPAFDTGRVETGLEYPEWDYAGRCYRDAQCRVVTATLVPPAKPDAPSRRRIRRIARRLQALRPERDVETAQPIGSALDIDAIVSARAELAAGRAPTGGVYLDDRRNYRDLSVTILLDASQSTDAYVDGHRIFDVEKEAVSALSRGLDAAGDAHAVYASTSRGRHRVSVMTLRDFRSDARTPIEAMLGRVNPGYYTRMGPALRYVRDRITVQPHRRRLIIVVSDGKPNDEDYYEGRYGIEDTRRAVREARQAGIVVFAVTVDRRARDYLPALFGSDGYALVRNPGRLSAALAAAYQQLIA